MKYMIFLLSLWCALEAKTVYWFTGLPCSGKTTIAQYLCNEHESFINLDGDELRKTLCADLGFSMEDRKKNLERIARYAVEKAATAEAVLVTTISPLEEQRSMVREIVENEGAKFVLVYVSTELNLCVERDVKGMYAKALNGEIKNFTGISSPYEAPKSAQLTFDTKIESLEEIATRFIEFHKL